MKEIFQKLHKYEIRIRKAVDSQMDGKFNSIFKGTGLEFDDVRAYQYGDDVRSIDWNVTAKGHGVFVKTFKEEKEQTIFFLVDVSLSNKVGISSFQKVDLAKELASVMCLSAIKEGSQVGLYSFSDKKEKFLKPTKGMKFAYSFIKTLYKINTENKGTNISQAIFSTLQLLKKKSVVILISDFIDNNYEQSLRALSKRHDLVILHIFDSRELKFPKVGIIPFFDEERNKRIWLNTSSPRFLENLQQDVQKRKLQIETFCKQNQVDYLAIETNEDYTTKLIRLFKVRNTQMKNK